MRQSLLMGNWKMNGTFAKVTALLHDLKLLWPDDAVGQGVVFPPAVYLPLVQQQLGDSPLAWGAQNVYPKDSGAFTGEISAPMLRDVGCRYVLVGHSERRQGFHEDEKFVAEKFHHVKEHAMIPVLCVGETQYERDNGLTEQVLRSQLLAITHHASGHYFKNCVVAYEPVWAIGTGRTATPEEAQSVHRFIRTLIAEFDEYDANELPIIYGGSVNETTASSLFAMPDVDGGLVGGASLQAQQFVEILKCIN